MKTRATGRHRRPSDSKTYPGQLRTLRAVACPSGLRGEPHRRGRLMAGHLVVPCAIGRGGVRHGKREGDGATPVGRLQLVGGFFRADRLARPGAPMRLRPLRPSDGWCDEPGHPAYNRPVRLPSPCGHENMWRDDGLYDVVIVLDYNLHPRRRGRGSAIFLHCAHADFRPTAGCVALRPADMRRLLPRLARRCRLTIG